MNPISAFFLRNIIPVFFFYGLAFFTMGLALTLASRRRSRFRFARAIRPLAAFGILHGAHEWVEMFQKVGLRLGTYTPTVPQEAGRLTVLGLSFLMLLVFGGLGLNLERKGRWRAYLPGAVMTALWTVSLLAVRVTLKPPPDEMTGLADVLLRYLLGIPGALVGMWALRAQRRTFREYGMPQFGRDLGWCAIALFLYGAVGQLFVRPTSLWPSTVVNSDLFLRWFGLPVQLFRAIMASVLAFYMIRALDAFELESRRRLEEAHRAKLRAQAAALEAERRTSREMERLNEELRLTTRELSLLLDLSNLLATPMSLRERLHNVLERIVRSLDFPDAGMILLIGRDGGVLHVQATIGFSSANGLDGQTPEYRWAMRLGEQCVAQGTTICRHRDGITHTLSLEGMVREVESPCYGSPLAMVSLPLAFQQQVIGSIVLACIQSEEEKSLSTDEFKLMLGVAQQLGLSIENARLHQEAQEREKRLGELLHQVVNAQEAERQRIARELHDATAQSLTAIALGLRGVEALLDEDPVVAVQEIRELKSFSTDALGELRRIISNLRPPQLDDLGLVAALQWYIQEFERRYGIPTDFVVEGSEFRLPSEYETVLFRITQEALTNIAKHAHASRAFVRLEIRPTHICVTIQDDGCGFDPEEVLEGTRPRTGWGLVGIQERALLLGGHYEIHSAPGQGTRIRVRVPLTMEPEDVQNTAVVG